MPQVIPAINAALASAVGGAAAAAGVSASAMASTLAFIGNYGVQTLIIAGSVSYSAAQQRKLKKALNGLKSGGLDSGRTTMIRDPLAPHRLIYGQVRVSGTITFFHQAQANGYHYMVVTLARHECAELGTIYFDNEEVPLDGSGNATGTYAGYAQVRKFTGLAAGERDTTWESEISSKWTSAHIGKNVARLHIRLKWNADKFPNGIPVISCLVKGKKVYDPREVSHDPDDPSTWAWSNNAALCTADFLHDSHFGKGVAWSRIVMPDLIEAANICDEAVVLAT